ncbi:trypsin-like peptidase domain-containing protein [Gordonia jacobaea]|uniref:trypsin-like peptidase domain-containing protein n=1 Tax=Gordonia jacobaea TaxID=122202 RepID=UPI003D7577DD
MTLNLNYPIDWQSRKVQEALRILEVIYRPSEIERVIQEAGIPPHEIAWDSRPALTWRSVLDLASAQGKVPLLLRKVADQVPALSVRIGELLVDQVLDDQSEDIPRTQLTTWKHFSTDGKQEAIVVAGQPSFLEISSLSLGLDRARSVCRLIATYQTGRASGTGFLIGDDLILTCLHVLYDKSGCRAQKVEAWFDYETDASGMPKSVFVAECDPDSIVGEHEDDWAVVRTVDPMAERYGCLNLADAPAPEVDDRVFIIQHPYGQTKKVAFNHNLVRYTSERYFQYWTDTDKGSSGSPVFNESWQVIGLHHYSVRAPDADRVNIRNQGRSIKFIVERLRTKGIPAGGKL